MDVVAGEFHGDVGQHEEDRAKDDEDRAFKVGGSVAKARRAAFNFSRLRIDV